MSRAKEHGEKIADWFNNSHYAHGFLTGVLLDVCADKVKDSHYLDAVELGLGAILVSAYSCYRWRGRNIQSPETLREHNEVR